VKAFLQDADIFIFDSPFTGLDVSSRKEVKELIERRSKGSTIIVIADVEDIPSVITHVAEVDKGSLNFFGTVKEFARGSTSSFQPGRFSGNIPFQQDSVEFDVV